MNRLLAARFCAVCRLDLFVPWREATLHRVKLHWNRQMGNGLCDGCQRDRYHAARDYERAAEQVRTMLMLGAGWSNHRPPIIHPELLRAKVRAEAAAARCVRLKMWDDKRPRNALFIEGREVGP